MSRATSYRPHQDPSVSFWCLCQDVVFALKQKENPQGNGQFSLWDLMGGLKVIGVRLGFPSSLNRKWAKQNSYVYIRWKWIWFGKPPKFQNKKDGYDELVSYKHPPGPFRSDLKNDLSTLTLACQNFHAYTMHPFLRNLTQQFNQLQDAKVYRHYRPEVSFRCVGSLVPTKHGFTIMNRNNF